MIATFITLLINSMAAFALSKYKFRGRDAILVLIISTLMVPVSVILVPAFFVLFKVGLTNNLWGLIIPGAATPTGVFLLRQYMLTIPDDLMQSARIDGASEWRIYSQIILPLTGPALAVLAIFSVMWRWNDFLWPLVAINQSELFTLQVGLRAFHRRAEPAVELHPGDDGADAAAHQHCVCVPGKIYHHRDCHHRYEIIISGGVCDLSPRRNCPAKRLRADRSRFSLKQRCRNGAADPHRWQDSLKSLFCAGHHSH